MRKTVLATAAMLAALGLSPLTAQGRGDPTVNAAGDGKLPAGWMMRFDPVPASRPQPKPTDVKFVVMGDGFHATSGPAAIYYRTADMGKGEFSVNATFAQSKSMQHEAYGIFIGGTNLQDSTQNYLYFVIKPFEGTYQIKRRASDTSPARATPVVDAAVMKDDPTDGHAKNSMTIHVAKDSIHFIVNGKLVRAMAKEPGVATDGIVGLRINHNEDLHITGFGIKK